MTDLLSISVGHHPHSWWIFPIDHIFGGARRVPEYPAKYDVLMGKLTGKPNGQLFPH